MARKDDRIWTKCFLFIYAKICVNVKCHLDHALFMVWLFSSLKKKRRRKRRSGSMLVWSFPQTVCGSHWQVSNGESSDSGPAPASAYLVWACSLTLLSCSDLGSFVKHCLSFSAARNHVCASPWIEGCAACKIPKDNFIYSCCKQCLYKVY